MDGIKWAVWEDGNEVYLRITCRDNYEAIELAEVIGEGVRGGRLEMEFEDDGTTERDGPLQLRRQEDR